jgi:hypothetical protein
MHASHHLLLLLLLMLDVLISIAHAQMQCCAIIRDLPCHDALGLIQCPWLRTLLRGPHAPPPSLACPPVTCRHALEPPLARQKAQIWSLHTANRKRLV